MGALLLLLKRHDQSDRGIKCETDRPCGWLRISHVSCQRLVLFRDDMVRGRSHLVQADIVLVFRVQALYELAQRRNNVLAAGRVGPGRCNDLFAADGGGNGPVCRGCGILSAGRAGHAGHFCWARGATRLGRWELRAARCGARVGSGGGEI